MQSGGTGCHSARVSWCYGHPAMPPPPGFSPPFSSSGTTVRFHMSTIERYQIRISPLLYQQRKKPLPVALLRPSVKAVIDRCVRPVCGWAITPTATGLQHVDNPAQYAAVINALVAARITRHPFFKNRPFLIVQPKQLLHIQSSLKGLNHISLNEYRP
jgi:hypothetical protein